MIPTLFLILAACGIYALGWWTAMFMLTFPDPGETVHATVTLYDVEADGGI